MTMRILIVGALLISVATLSANQPQGKQGESKTSKSGASKKTAPKSWEERIQAALARKQDWQVKQMSLDDLTEYIQRQTKVPVDLDRRALNEIGLSASAKVNLSANKITGRAALNLMLSRLGLTWIVRDDVLTIVTPEVAESELVTKIIPITDLTRVGTSKTGEPLHDSDDLIEGIQTIVHPDSWEEVGGAGTMRFLSGSLIVTQDRHVMEELEAYISAFRRTLKAVEQGGKATPASVPLYPATDGPIRKQLAARVDLTLKDVALRDALKVIQSKAGVNLLIDERALEEIGIDPGTKVTLMARDSALSTVLRRMLHQLGLVWTVRDEVVMVTTPEIEESALTARFYPVHDLLTSGTAYGTDMEKLIETVTSIVSTDSWDEVGGPGSIVAIKHSALAVSQTLDVHEQMEKLLQELRKAADTASALETQGKKNAEKNAGEVRLEVYPLDSVSPADAQRLIRNLLGAKAFDSHEKAVLDSAGSSLVVRHTAAMHQQIRKLLSKIDPGLNGQGGLGAGSGGGFGGGGGGF